MYAHILSIFYTFSALRGRSAMLRPSTSPYLSIVREAVLLIRGVRVDEPEPDSEGKTSSRNSSLRIKHHANITIQLLITVEPQC
ncbi:uncharacterized protein F5147DRAFT_727925 [Suillus discolor]|uniref:Uncharacterized protein n=1 Tax=Suillus discolor TaxID=1912936 RepID=A0A9P7ERY4_9AGAM|nr:uncharacterized protein F5147DRAFT_727925 [Suillus discolor]KAG2087373.1 hypothetical protein F5147DRAFT_727925 [Suillus discolor]